MTIKLLHHTPLFVCSTAIRKCWASEDKSDSYYKQEWNRLLGCYDDGEYVCGDKDKELIERIGNQNKHKSTLEHLVYTFDINGISRACLQELARHRMASYSVKSTRYTLKELKDEKEFDCELTADIERASKYIVIIGNSKIDKYTVSSLNYIRDCLIHSNDITKYMLPEAYKTSLVMTINARSLQNFLALRTSKHALWEIRDLANEMYNKLPEDHKYLFTDFISKE